MGFAEAFRNGFLIDTEITDDIIGRVFLLGSPYRINYIRGPMAAAGVDRDDPPSVPGIPFPERFGFGQRESDKGV
jgi:hypothetical protein